MVTGYNLEIDEYTSEFQDYIKIGEEHLKSQKAKIQNILKSYVIDGVTDGTKLETDWFPQIQADIFISHSHKDEDLAKEIAGWLNSNLGLKCFIDSCVWGDSDKLLDMINNDYSEGRELQSGGYVYDYKKCNTASKHVNNMLTIALYKMIDKAEVTFLLNTNNSISKYKDVYEQATYSPWIYSEIVCTQIVRKKKIAEYRKGNKIWLEHRFEKNDGLNAAYEVSLEHLKKIDIRDLHIWKENYNSNKVEFALDYLYKMTYEEAKCIPVEI